MVHVGYEASAVLGGNKKLGDTWKMLSWTLSGRMGGVTGKPTNGNGNTRPVALAPAAQQENEVFRIL
jgi:hypothetical protein